MPLLSDLSKFLQAIHRRQVSQTCTVAPKLQSPTPVVPLLAKYICSLKVKEFYMREVCSINAVCHIAQPLSNHNLLFSSGDFTSTSNFPTEISFQTGLELHTGRHLTCVASLEKIHQRLLSHLEASLHNRLLSLQLALSKPLRQLLPCCWVLLDEVKHDKALHAYSLCDDFGYLLSVCHILVP